LLITKVELKNIKNHAEAEFTFQPGVIAICGPNGAGKTTILEAIAWALFDHLDYKRDDFVRRGAKRGQVAVSFVSDLDDREYVVTRDTGTGYHVYDPVTKARLVEQKNQVVPWLRQHLKAEPDADLAALFKSTIGVPQGTFTHDFTLSPANRKNVFDQILKVEEYRQASDNLRDTVRHIEGRIAEADKRVAEAEGELKAYDETKREHDETAARSVSLERDAEQAAQQRDRTAGVVAKFDELQRKLEAERAAIERLRVRLQLKKDSLVTARESVHQARRAAEIVAAAGAGYGAYLTANARLAELEQQRESRDALRKRQAEIEHELVEARSQMKMAEQRLAETAAARDEFGTLADKIEAQGSIERDIADGRERRGELQSLRTSLDALDRSIERLDQRRAELTRQIEAAAALAEKAARVEALEDERQRLEAEINRAEVASGAFKLKREHLESLRKDHARLAEERENNSRETAKLEKLVPAAAKLAEVESQQQASNDRLATLRAEVARDEEMIRALESGGVCPLLTEKCLNLKPGESLDGRFRNGLDARRGEIESLTRALNALAKEIKQSRAAATETARLPYLQGELARLGGEIEAKQKLVAEIEAEIAPAANGDAGLQELKSSRAALEPQLREAREAQRLSGQAEVLKNEIAGVISETGTNRAERVRLATRIADIGDIEAQIANAERRLRELNDPRSRAAALGRTIEREAEWQGEAERAAQSITEINLRLDQVKAEMQAFAALDADIAATMQTRAKSEGDYHAFIQNEKTAATRDAREQELRATEAEIQQTETTLAATLAEQSQLEQEYNAEQHRRAQVELDEWRERATQLATQLETTRQQFERLKTQLARLEEVRERMREHLAAKEKARTMRETAEFIRDILQKAAPYITEVLLLSISAEANQLFREITGRFDVSLRWGKDYEVTLEEEGRERPFLNLSGGEQMAAALAVRLALLKELSEINIAFFDEPTTNMDEERRRNLAQQIGRIKDFHQLFVISHDDSFEGFTDQIVMLGAKG
jgi:exonuclease SbcC